MVASPRDDGRFRASIPPHSADAAALRDRFRAWLDRIPIVDRATAEELLVVFAELTTNAIEATDDPAERVHVDASVEPPDVFLEVVNRLPRAPHPGATVDLEDPLRPRGRGLFIVEAFTDEVDVTQLDDLVYVRCRRLVGARPHHGS